MEVGIATFGVTPAMSTRKTNKMTSVPEPAREEKMPPTKAKLNMTNFERAPQSGTNSYLDSWVAHSRTMSATAKMMSVNDTFTYAASIRESQNGVDGSPSANRPT